MVDVYTLEAGRDLDALITKHLYGWEPQYRELIGGLKREATPYFSIDIADAWRIIETFDVIARIETGWYMGAPGWMATFYSQINAGYRHEAWAPTAPLAICRVALLHVGCPAQTSDDLKALANERGLCLHHR